MNINIKEIYFKDSCNQLSDITACLIHHIINIKARNDTIIYYIPVFFHLEYQLHMNLGTLLKEFTLNYFLE